MKAKYLLDGDRFRYSEHYSTPKGSPPLPAYASYQSAAELSASNHLDEQIRLQQLQKPEVNETSLADFSDQETEMRTRFQNFRQVRDGKVEKIDAEITEKVAEIIRDELIKNLPTNFPRQKDWRDEGVIGEVLDQGVCGTYGSLHI